MNPENKYENVAKVLAYVVYSNAYGPVDRMARAIDVDMVRSALYEALRYVATRIRECLVYERGEKQPSKEALDECRVLKELTGYRLPDEEIEQFLRDLESRGVGIAKRISVRALSMGVNLSSRGIEKR